MTADTLGDKIIKSLQTKAIVKTLQTHQCPPEGALSHQPSRQCCCFDVVRRPSCSDDKDHNGDVEDTNDGIEDYDEDKDVKEYGYDNMDEYYDYGIWTMSVNMNICMLAPWPDCDTADRVGLAHVHSEPVEGVPARAVEVAPLPETA